MHHLSSLREQNTKDHSQSVKKLPSDWIIFEELSRTGIHYNIKSVTNISPVTVALFIDANNLNSTYSTAIVNGHPKAELILNNWIDFDSNYQTIKLVIDLREKINNLVTKKIVHPHKTNTLNDEDLIHLIAGVLSREDSSIGLFQPNGIGQRPKTFLINNYPMVNDVFKEINKKSNPKSYNKSIPEILKFKPISNNIYNQYLPHFVNTKLENEPNTTKYGNINYNMQAPAYYTNPNPQCDLTYLSQNLLMMNLYNPAKPEYENVQYLTQSQTVNVQNDFDSNGIDVNDEDDDAQGACAVPKENRTHQYLINWFNNCDPRETNYFIIKAGGMKSIEISISKKTWIFSPQTERKLLRLFQVRKYFILIIHIQSNNSPSVSNCYFGR